MVPGDFFFFFLAPGMYSVAAVSMICWGSPLSVWLPTPQGREGETGCFRSSTWGSLRLLEDSPSLCSRLNACRGHRRRQLWPYPSSTMCLCLSWSGHEGLPPHGHPGRLQQGLPDTEQILHLPLLFPVVLPWQIMEQKDTLPISILVKLSPPSTTIKRSNWERQNMVFLYCTSLNKFKVFPVLHSNYNY